jgi:hypothetical protein
VKGLTSGSLEACGLRIIETKRSQQTTFAAAVSDQNGRVPISSDIS